MADQGSSGGPSGGPSPEQQRQMDGMSVSELADRLMTNAREGNAQMAGYLGNTLNSKLAHQALYGRPSNTTVGPAAREHLPAGSRSAGHDSARSEAAITGILAQQRAKAADKAKTGSPKR